MSSIIPFAGSGLLGYAMGFVLKKVFTERIGWDVLYPCCVAQFRHQTSINGSRGVGAMLRMLSKKRN
ncbi:MAG: hypothetical protein WA364_27990 [Candidatus Nitrosopolaris sp.]